jgi:tetratricopeptide (TPR) repeat protein
MDFKKLLHQLFIAIRWIWGFLKLQIVTLYPEWQYRRALQYLLKAEYTELPNESTVKNLKQVIKCYQKALRVCTEQRFPLSYIMFQNRLGVTYGNLPTEDRTENLQKAITCYQNALRRLPNCPEQEVLQPYLIGNGYIPNEFFNAMEDEEWKKGRAFGAFLGLDILIKGKNSFFVWHNISD